MSLDPLFYALWQIFGQPLTYAAALTTCLGVGLAFIAAISRIGKSSNNSGQEGG